MSHFDNLLTLFYIYMRDFENAVEKTIQNLLTTSTSTVGFPLESNI